jgi:hypothetical protein
MADSTSSIIPLPESWRTYLVSTWPRTLITILVFLLILFVGIAVRRLYFSPISHFPGPKLAAITLLYEIYYDVYLGGKFTLHLQALHGKYGK